MKKNVRLLAVLAGTAVSATAMAQEFGPLPFGGEVRVQPIGFPAPEGGYNQRAIDNVYDCLTAAFGNGSSLHLGACSNALEDVNFAPGPWATSTGRIMTEMTLGLAVLTTPTTADEQVRVIFWDQDDVNYTGFTGVGTSMINESAVPLGILNLGLGVQNFGFYYQFTVALTGFPGGGIAIPDDDNGIFVQIAWVTSSTYAPTNPNHVPLDTNASGGVAEGCASATTRSIVFSSQSNAAVGGNPASPGFTSASYGRDMGTATMCPNLGTFVGAAAAAAGGDVEHRFINATPARGVMLRFRGDISAPLPTPVSGDFACVNDGTTTQTGTIASSEVKWYTVCLNGDATDGALQFADFDTEGSSADVAIGLFNQSGGLIATNEDGGSGTNAQLSFGVGIRPGVGDGDQYAGRSGQLNANLPGESYWIAVAPAGSSFGAGFTAAPSANPGGDFSLNVTTNVNGAALAPSVEPFINGVDLGFIDVFGAQAPAAETGLNGFVWYKFSTAFDTGCRFLDIHLAGAGHTPTADSEAFIFDSAGLLVAEDDDSSVDFLSQFSFSNTDVAARPAIGNGLPFEGQDGNLPAGTYYMGVGLFDVIALVSGDRWHLRGTSGSNLNVAPVFASDFDGTNGECNACPVCAADYDQDGGVTGSDVEAFFTDFEAGAGCADVDLDGGVTGSDVEAFFLVFEAGGC